MISKCFNALPILINTHIWKGAMFEKEIDNLPPRLPQKMHMRKIPPNSPSVHSRCLNIYYFLPSVPTSLLHVLAGI